MLTLLRYELVTLLAALAIGIVTAWWAYGGRARAGHPIKTEDEKSS